jgi:membrane protein DedA with SNARE-associated domain
VDYLRSSQFKKETMHVIFIYLGILIGVVFEGEMIMISSIIAAHHGYLNLWIVIALGITGTFFADFFYFLLGKKKGRQLVERKEKIKNRMNSIRHKMKKNSFLVFLSYRFMYGFRSITPLIIGTSNFHTRRFLLNSFFSILLWATTYSLLGYFLGSYIKSELGHIQHIEKYIIAFFILAGIGIIIIRKRIMKKREAQETLE